MTKFLGKNWRKNLNIIMLILVFLAPLVLAIAFYINQNFWQFDSKQLGELIQPPLPIADLPLYTLIEVVADDESTENTDTDTANAGEDAASPVTSRVAMPWVFDDEWQWRLLYYTPSCRGQACLLQLAKMQSIHQSTGKDFSRVSSLLVTPQGAEPINEALLENFNHLTWLQIAPEGVASCLTEHSIFIVDPAGNIILRFEDKTPGGEILHDLRHLLKVSQIG